MSEKEPQEQSVLAGMPPAKAIVKLAVPATLALLPKPSTTWWIPSISECWTPTSP